MFFAALNSEIFKYVIFVCAIPLWLPFLKALLAELNDALATEGGLFGRTPSSKEIAFIERDPNRAKSPLVSHETDPDDLSAGEQAQRRPAAGQARGPTSKTAPRGGKPAGFGFSKPRGGRGLSRKDRGKR